MKVETWNIDRVVPYARNPRVNDEAVAGVAASIKEFGWQQPIVVDKEGVIVAGHTRFKAAQRLGLKEVPVVRAYNLTPQQVKAYRILDNKLHEKASWEPELLACELEDLPDFDFGDYDIEFDGQEDEPKTEDDEIPETQEKEISKLGDVWLCGQHRVYCGDCLDFKTEVKFDLLLTDPPYGVSYADKNEFLNSIDKSNSNQKKIENDHKTPEQMYSFWSERFNNIVKTLKDGAAYYITGPAGGDLLILLLSIRDSGLMLKHTIIWVKNNHVLGRSDYNYKHEPILYGWKPGAAHFYDGIFDVTVWEVDRPQVSREHPTMKPVALLTRAIQHSTKENQTVFDPFLGSGTTLIAAHRLNRICYGCEIAPNYVDVICRRFYNETGIIPRLESTGEEFPIDVKP